MSIQYQHVPDPPDFATAVEQARRFVLGLPEAGPGLPIVVAGGWELGRPDYRMTRPGTPVLALEFVLAGTGQLALGARRTRIAPGLVFTYGPDVAHRIQPDPGQRLSKYFLNLHGRVAAAALAAHQLAPGAIRRVGDPAPLQAAFDLLIAAGSRGGPGSAAVAGHLALALLGLVSEDSTADGTWRLGSWATWQRVLVLMQEHHLRVATVEGIAQLAGISPVHCGRLFALHGQETALQHLTRLRMRHAAGLLAQGIKAKEIAARLGFADQFHFSRCFRRVYGVSPRHFTTIAPAAGAVTSP